MIEWERNREQSEFDRAAVLYHKSGKLGLEQSTTNLSTSSRFVSASTVEELDVGKEASSVSARERSV